MSGNEPRYAVQGDISDCNLYISSDGQPGVFDFNNSGDNVLFYDAAMQAIFEATLMDYKEDLKSCIISVIRFINTIIPYSAEI